MARAATYDRLRRQFRERGQDGDQEAVTRVILAAISSGLTRDVVTKDQIKDVLLDREMNIDFRIPVERLFYAEDKKE